MDLILLEKQFARMGARVVVRPSDASRMGQNGRRQLETPVSINILADRRGEYFDIQAHFGRVQLDVIEVLPSQRQLLLVSRDLATGGKDKFVLAHNGRFWTVTPVIDDRAATVSQGLRNLTSVR